MRKNVILLVTLVTLVGVVLSGCSSEPTESATPPAKIEGARNDAPPEAQAAMKKAQDEQRARATAQGQAYGDGAKNQGAPR
jgi:uncharacterized protein YceK